MRHVYKNFEFTYYKQKITCVPKSPIASHPRNVSAQNQKNNPASPSDQRESQTTKTKELRVILMLFQACTSFKTKSRIILSL